MPAGASASACRRPSRSTLHCSRPWPPTTLSIISNDPDTPLITLALRGSGLLSPVIGAVPSQFALTMFKKHRQDQRLTLSNTGGNPLDFSLNLRTRSTAPDPALCTPRAYV